MNLQHPFHVTLSAQPTISATPDYADGDLIGTLMEFAGASRQVSPDSSERSYGGVIESVTIINDAAVAVNCEIVFFDSEPTASTFTDNAAADILAADAELICGAALISTHQPLTSVAVTYASGLHIPYQPAAASTSLWAILVATGAINQGDTDEITVRLGLLLD